MEFVEVTNNKERMCHTLALCATCPLYKLNNGTELYCESFIKNYPERAEELIMKWAEENSAKTNEQVFIEIMQEKFGDAFSDFPVDIVELTESCKYTCPNYPNCYGCKRKEAIEFWNKEYKEAEKDVRSN